MKVAIVGTAESSVQLAPFNDPAWQVWGLFGRSSLKRADMTFEMHDPSMWAAGEREEMAKARIPIVMREKHADIPACFEYPLREVSLFFDKFGAADLWTSSIAYMMAMAICRAKETETTTIGLWGVDMMLAEEFAAQRPTLEYLIGIGRALGIEMFVPAQSALLKANFVYGREAQQQATGITEAFLRARLETYQKGRAQAEYERNVAINKMNTYDGHIAETSALLQYVEHFNRGGAVSPGAKG